MEISREEFVNSYITESPKVVGWLQKRVLKDIKSQARELKSYLAAEGFKSKIKIIMDVEPTLSGNAVIDENYVCYGPYHMWHTAHLNVVATQGDEVVIKTRTGYVKYESDAGFPSLKGSVKQIAWAESIRNHLIYFNPSAPELEMQTEAKWWIDNRKNTF